MRARKRSEERRAIVYVDLLKKERLLQSVLRRHLARTPHNSCSKMCTIVYNIEILFFEKIFIKLFENYYDFINIFNKFKINKLFLYYFYNYKLKFINKINKTKLLKSYIYFII